ncbi:hypothetical protein ANN_16914 [Periplaneta americana]|uniref:Uncharacterized protein n=1 Tax=Periplaneta americana TaxID=6978 RepID=A0ABQ8SRF8_PERAM|nr:hypothetical protein ANN_16914 [Periplaneta americana]
MADVEVQMQFTTTERKVRKVKKTSKRRESTDNDVTITEVEKENHITNDHGRYHKICSVWNCLDENLRNRCIERRGPREWSSRSPDLNPLDFAVWSYLKEKMYDVKIRNLQHKRARIEKSVVKPPLICYTAFSIA